MSNVVNFDDYKKVRSGDKPWEYRSWICLTRKKTDIHTGEETHVTYMKKVSIDDLVTKNLARITIEVRGNEDWETSIIRAKKRIDKYERDIAEQRANLHNT